MDTEYRIRLSKEPFTFAAAHFITFNGNICEPLHGHNYHVTVELAGPLDENGYVRDFVATREALAKLIAQLDHCVILPTKHPQILVETSADQGHEEVVARYESRRWVFPAEECTLLPIMNTTAELLAKWIGEQLLQSLSDSKAGGTAPTELIVEVDECDGQVGICRISDL